MKYTFCLGARRYLSLINALLLLWSLAWSASADALTDWIWVETTRSFSADEFPTSPSTKSDMQASCNGACILWTQLQGPVAQSVAIPLTSRRGAQIYKYLFAITSAFVEPPYHPPRLSS
jgi:hypothetical protein